jgi:hypothetical protein
MRIHKSVRAECFVDLTGKQWSLSWARSSRGWIFDFGFWIFDFRFCTECLVNLNVFRVNLSLAIRVHNGGLGWTWVDLGGLSVEFAGQKSIDSSVKFHLARSVLRLSDLWFVPFLMPISAFPAGLRFSFCDCSFYIQEGWQVEKLVDFPSCWAAMV